MNLHPIPFKCTCIYEENFLLFFNIASANSGSSFPLSQSFFYKYVCERQRFPFVGWSAAVSANDDNELWASLNIVSLEWERWGLNV
jgi:hypothetical protein